MTTEQLLYRLWAKTNDYERGKAKRRGEPVPEPRRHPLPCHLIDVGFVAETWLEADGHLLERFCALWPGVPREDVRRALVLAAALHDLGKVYPDFQAKSDEGWAHGYGDVWKGAKPTGKGFDHGAGTGRIFRALFYEDAPLDVDARWRPMVPLMRIAAGHHGRLYDHAQIAPDQNLAYSPLLSGLVRATLDEIVALFGPVPELPGEPPNDFLMLAAGFVSVADWFGSDTHFFDFAAWVVNPETARRYLAQLRQRQPALEALRAAGLITALEVPGTFEELFSPKDARWAPRPGFQTEACGASFGEVQGPEIVVVEAPMGLGKTEIALYLAAQALRRGTASGLYFALPTQATSNALFDRVADYAGRVKGDLDLALALAHGGKQYFESYRRLRRKTSRLPFIPSGRSASDDAVPSEVVAPAWMQPSKRALLAPVGLGTVDQAMLGAMGVQHGFVRLFGLARKVVVFDEIHAYDAYMNVLIVHLLRWLHALGAKVILLSATLPRTLRRALLGAYGVTEADAPDPAADPYPQVLHGLSGEAARRLVDPAPGADRPHKSVRVEPVEAEDVTAAGVERVIAEVEKGGCIVWIRNTVREAQEGWRQLRAAGIEADLLHARFTRHDRNEKEAQLLERFGTPAPENPARPARRVVVATQVIEQSVDVDFDLMLSDLAPVDLLLQRAGRLHRHDRPRPRRQGHPEPVLVVLMPAAGQRAALRFGNSSYVYDADTLARSAALVHAQPGWTLPDACRTLVADLYDRDEDYWTAAWLGCEDEALAEARARIEQRHRQMQSVAERARITPPGDLPVMRAAARDDGENDVGVGLSTRYGGRSAALVLFRDEAEGPVPAGAKASFAVPPDDDYGARLRVEEAIAMATVAFPWYGALPETSPPDALKALASWWKEQHPYDARAFALLRADGTVSLDGMNGRYDDHEGLVLERPPSGKTTRALQQERAPFEDL